jgi:hypothetical protein
MQLKLRLLLSLSMVNLSMMLKSLTHKSTSLTRLELPTRQLSPIAGTETSGGALQIGILATMMLEHHLAMHANNNGQMDADGFKATQDIPQLLFHQHRNEPPTRFEETTTGGAGPSAMDMDVFIGVYLSTVTDAQNTTAKIACMIKLSRFWTKVLMVLMAVEGIEADPVSALSPLHFMEHLEINSRRPHLH